MSRRQLWAKSPPRGRSTGELLIAHLSAALEAMDELRSRVGRVAVLPERFWTWARLAILLHDAGKVTDGFQTMVGNGARPAEPWGERHEVYSLGFVARVLADADQDDLLWVATGVATHHRPFTGPDDRRTALFTCYDEVDPDEFAGHFGTADPDLAAELQDWLASTARAHGLLSGAGGPVLTGEGLGRDAHRLFEVLRERWEEPLATGDRDGLTAVLLQGAVTLADHVSSAHSRLSAEPPLTSAYPARLRERLSERQAELRPHQVAAAAVDGHLLLRAPTGSGKTEASLLWALTQLGALRCGTGGLPRLFYVLPYLASINAMAGRLSAELDTPEIGVVHSRAASYHLARALRDDCVPAGEAAPKAVSRAAVTRLFRELVRVGTPYQLLRGALAGPAHSGILIDAANSVFILDELHAYDPRRLGMILAMLRLWEDLGGRIAVLSATLPDALADLLDTTLAVPCRRVAPAGSWPQRHRVTVRADHHLTEPPAIAEITGRVRAGQAVLVVANNVADARALYEELAPLAVERYGSEAALLLHSRFRRRDRSRIEAAIQARFGTGRPRCPGILVATQVVEVSLDVDFDALYTSGAPLDALLQRFGRVNRLGARPPAPVVVHQPAYRPRRGGSVEYADGVYDADPTRLAVDLLTRHDGQVVDERDVLGWLNEIYAGDWGTRWRRSVDQFRDQFRTAFLGFTHPFDDRGWLAERFDELFDGAEAVLTDDLDEYATLLRSARGSAGRLLAEELLIPLPSYTVARCRWDRQLKVRVLAAGYDPDHGLGELHGPTVSHYSLGEML